MRQIFVLGEETVGKIAAGEVVDRPASVVKELVENSLDAGCSHVLVEVGNGGRDYIRITDDGCGICEADVELAFEKHATSKIQRIEDLASLQTLGFRGEALPSIAAVARIEISTRHESEDFGTVLKVEGGVITERRRITRGVGTTIEVKSLFYNLPARVGTIKSKSTELRHIVEVCTQYAVIYPEVKFELFHDKNPIMSTLGTGKMLDALVNTYGSALAKELIALKASDSPDHDVTVSGYISKPSASYGTKKHLLTYVNRRFVKSEVVEKAVKRGYMSLLPKHAYPFAVISLQINPNEINVNIHPKKHEIRFFGADTIAQLLANAVTTTLRRSDLIPDVVQSKDSIEAGGIDLFGIPKEKKAAISVQTSFQEAIPKVAHKEGGGEGPLRIRTAPLYQVLDSYIVAQSEEDDVILIDQHAAAERINYEQLMEKFGGRIDKQTLLRPYVPELTPHQFYLVRENEQTLRAMGFELERLGEDSYIIRTIPVIFQGMTGEGEIIEVIMRLLEEHGKDEERIKVLFSTAACKASIKAGEKQSYETMRAIVERLKRTKMPFTCPHGRPTMIRMSKKEIEKRFKRR